MVVCITSRSDSKVYYPVDEPKTILLYYDRRLCKFVISFKSNHKQHIISLSRFDITGNCERDTNR